MPFENSITGGQGALVRPAIKSPNFQTGVQGWSINRNGSAEFNNVIIRGDFEVGNATTHFLITGTIPAELVTHYAPRVMISVAISQQSAGNYIYVGLLNTGSGSQVTGTVSAGVVVEYNELFASGTQPTNFIGGDGSTTFTAYGSGSAVEFNALVDLLGAFQIDGRTQGRGNLWVAGSTNLAVGPAAGEQILYTGPSAVYVAGRCYELRYSFLGATAAAGDITIAVRKGTTTAGTQLAGERTGTPVAARAETCRGWPRIRNATGSPVTTQVVLTATPNAGNGTYTSTTTSVGRFEAWDIGAAADFPNEPQI
jgi:hypothetical protein